MGKGEREGIEGKRGREEERGRNKEEEVER